MGSLSFSSPFLLLALLALPAIWLLLRATPPSPQRVPFPAFDILRRLAKTTETPERTPWWVLLLRLAIAGLAIIGLAGPILNAPAPPASAGPLVIVVDNSWAAAPAWRVRRDAIETLAEQALRARRDAYLIKTVDAESEPPSLMSATDLKEAAATLRPEPFLPDYARAREKAEALRGEIRDAEIFWLSDGLAHAGAGALHKALQGLGAVVVETDDDGVVIALAPPIGAAARADARIAYQVHKAGPAPWSGAVVAMARDGRELARSNVEITQGDAIADVTLDLPLALQNDMAEARLEGVASAGAVQLADARERRALIGLVASGKAGADPLLSGTHYVSKALGPYAVFVTDTLENLLKSDASVIVLDDVGVLRPADADALTAFVKKGGVVIRFAGPRLAEAAEDSTPALLPVALRGGGRAFGGALTWETPQPIGAFSKDGPFNGIAPPQDILVRRQVLAEPGGATAERTWASLEDGTPLVTGETIGAGVVALFHVTATPEWSDLPLSSAFVAMLRKLTFLSALGPKALGERAGEKAAPFRTLDGFGALRQPPRDLPAATLAELDAGAAPGRPPGLYGAPEAPVAVNAVSGGASLAPFAVEGAAIRAYAGKAPVAFAPPLFLIALLLLLADGLFALRFAGKLALASLVLALTPIGREASAEPLDRPLGEQAIEAALEMRLAFVRTGDPATDRLSEAGLAGLSREIARRTSAEPATPVGVDPETDDLSVYPFLYWPVVPGAATPSEASLANIETFMRFGGLVVFDTQDDERAIAGVETPESAALKAILSGIDIPPLEPAPADHVLHRSFYLLSDLPGRAAARPVFVQAGDGPNDSVTPIIIGGRDWAGAWASNEVGEPLLPMIGAARPCAAVEPAIPRSLRECAYRAGVNMVMVALTGNYKSDQVHTPILLERLGRE